MIETLTRSKTKKREAVFHKIANEIKLAIKQGVLVPGQPLPSENTLASEYGISRSSVRSALSLLEDKNLIFKKPGKGTFVRDNTEPKASKHKVKIHNLAFEGFQEGLSPSVVGYFYSNIIYSSMLKAAEKRNCRITSISANHVPLLSDGMADSLLTLFGESEKYDIYRYLHKNNVYPLLFNRIVDIEGISYVAVDYLKAAKQGMNRLLYKGHKRIAWVETSVGNSDFNQRYRGIVEAVNESDAKVELLACSVKERQSDEFYEESLYKFLSENDVSAIYLLNGSFAAPLFNACRRLKLNIPKDLEVICFDHIEELYYFYKMPFMYINMPLEQMAADAVNHLIDCMESGKSVPVMKKLYESEIISIGY
jgi:GntR family transcriptional regulator, arabinose operon transcriptional repressor